MDYFMIRIALSCFFIGVDLIYITVTTTFYAGTIKKVVRIKTTRMDYYHVEHNEH